MREQRQRYTRVIQTHYHLTLWDLKKLFKNCLMAHAHLQESDVSRSESGESEKHLGALQDGQPAGSGNPLSSKPPPPGSPWWETNWQRVCPPVWTCQPLLSNLMQDGLVSSYKVSLLSLHSTQVHSPQVVCLRGLQDLAKRQGSQSKEARGRLSGVCYCMYGVCICAWWVRGQVLLKLYILGTDDSLHTFFCSPCFRLCACPFLWVGR